MTKESLNELSANRVKSYVNKSMDSGVVAMQKRDKLPGNSTNDDIQKFQNTINKRVRGLTLAKKKLKMTKEEVINNTINKFIKKDERPLRERVESVLEEATTDRSKQRVMELFDSLDESNQKTLFLTISEENGINEIMDFIISNKE